MFRVVSQLVTLLVSWLYGKGCEKRNVRMYHMRQRRNVLGIFIKVWSETPIRKRTTWKT